MINKQELRKRMDNAMEGQFNISGKALSFMEQALLQFAFNLTKNSVKSIIAKDRTTLMKEDLVQSLDSVDLVIKNIPKLSQISTMQVVKKEVLTPSTRD
jgi:histone H3/H4